MTNTNEKEIKIKIKKPTKSKTLKNSEIMENKLEEQIIKNKEESLIKENSFENKNLSVKQEKIKETENQHLKEKSNDNNFDYEIDSTLNHIIIGYNELKHFYFLEDQQKIFSEELQDYVYSEHDVYSIKELFNDINQSLSRYKNRLYKAKFSGDWDNFLTKNELLRFIKKLSLEINSRLKFNLIEEPEDSIFFITNNEKLNKAKNENVIKTKNKRSSKKLKNIF